MTADLRTMARPAFERRGEKLEKASSAVLDDLIAAGFGDWRGSDVRHALAAGRTANGSELDKETVALFKRYVEVSDARTDWLYERDFRLKMHGCLRPWKRRLS